MNKKELKVDNFNVILRKEHNKRLKYILYHNYGIKIKTIQIKNTKSYYGYTYYLPYCVCETNREDTFPLARVFWNKKVYRTLDEILEDAKKGILNLEFI